MSAGTASPCPQEASPRTGGQEKRLNPEVLGVDPRPGVWPTSGQAEIPFHSDPVLHCTKKLQEDTPRSLAQGRESEITLHEEGEKTSPGITINCHLLFPRSPMKHLRK